MSEDSPSYAGGAARELSRDELVALLGQKDAEIARLRAELLSAVDGEDHEVLVLSIQAIAGDDGQWLGEFLAWYQPEQWLGEHRAVQAFLAKKVTELRRAAESAEDRDFADTIFGSAKEDEA